VADILSMLSLGQFWRQEATMAIKSDHEPKDFSRAFVIAIILNGIYVVVGAAVSRGT
jgi:hypothetical protein